MRCGRLVLASVNAVVIVILVVVVVVVVVVVLFVVDVVVVVLLFQGQHLPLGCAGSAEHGGPRPRSGGS